MSSLVSTTIRSRIEVDGRRSMCRRTGGPIRLGGGVSSEVVRAAALGPGLASRLSLGSAEHVTAYSDRVSDITLRSATSDDAHALAGLSLESSAYYAEIAPETHLPGEEEGFAEWIVAEWDEGPKTLALVAEIQGKIAGYLEATIQEPPEWGRFFGSRDLRERRLYINALLTAGAYRRRGVATRLVEAAEDWGRQRGARVALLDTFYESPLSVPFWEERMGYARRSIIFRKRLQRSDHKGK
jgi:GNAT superfamily N-acetyltransferase